MAARQCIAATVTQLATVMTNVEKRMEVIASRNRPAQVSFLPILRACCIRTLEGVRTILRLGTVGEYNEEHKEFAKPLPTRKPVGVCCH